MLTPTLTAPVDCRLALRLVAPRGALHAVAGGDQIAHLQAV